MDTRWSSHLPSDEQEDFEKLVLNSTRVLSRLYSILDEEEKMLDRAEFSYSDFDQPNWSFKQAARNADRGRIRKMKDLINFVK